MLQELKTLNSKMVGMRVDKLDSLCDSLEKLVIENRNCLKVEFAQKTKEIQDNLDLEIGHVMIRIEQMEAKIDQVRDRSTLVLTPMYLLSSPA